ncbi:MAG: hypothetical protein JO281_07490 [Pseudonocardiales bacterium]|nr:hypothetical protein [Pseudonocardiales bacterium]
MPHVEGARIPPNSPGNAPCRITARSSIDSAPATMPATTEVIFTPVVAAALPAEAGSRTRCWATAGNPARSANRSTGTRPAHDTRFGSSNLADTAAAV